jgi:hypothetical protein
MGMVMNDNVRGFAMAQNEIEYTVWTWGHSKTGKPFTLNGEHFPLTEEGYATAMRLLLERANEFSPL